MDMAAYWLAGMAKGENTAKGGIVVSIHQCTQCAFLPRVNNVTQSMVDSVFSPAVSCRECTPPSTSTSSGHRAGSEHCDQLVAGRLLDLVRQVGQDSLQRLALRPDLVLDHVVLSPNRDGIHTHSHAFTGIHRHSQAFTCIAHSGVASTASPDNTIAPLLQMTRAACLLRERAQTATSGHALVAAH